MQLAQALRAGLTTQLVWSATKLEGIVLKDPARRPKQGSVQRTGHAHTQAEEDTPGRWSRRAQAPGQPCEYQQKLCRRNPNWFFRDLKRAFGVQPAETGVKRFGPAPWNALIMKWSCLLAAGYSTACGRPSLAGGGNLLCASQNLCSWFEQPTLEHRQLGARCLPVSLLGLCLFPFSLCKPERATSPPPLVAPRLTRP